MTESVSFLTIYSSQVTNLPVCGLKISRCSSSIAAKKSAIGLVPSVLGASFDVDGAAVVEIGFEEDADVEGQSELIS